MAKETKLVDFGQKIGGARKNEIMRKQKLTRITRNFSDFDIHKSTPKEENNK